jgi:signal transduction histidine kinase
VKRRWLWPALALLTVALAGLIGEWTTHPIVDGPLRGAVAVAFAAASAVAFAQYRNTHDPRPLFIAIGAGLFAVQFLVFRVAWQGVWHLFDLHLPSSQVIGGGRIRPAFLPGPDDSQFSQLPDYGLLAGWIAAGVSFLLTLPWRDRRGRRPPSAKRFLLSIVGPLVLFDVIIVVFPPPPVLASFSTFAPFPPFAPTTGYRHALGPLAWILALLAVLILAIQAWREWRRSTSGVSSGPLVAALVAGIFAVGSTFLGEIATAQTRHSGPGALAYGAIGWARVLPLTTASFLLVGMLLSERAESSRMRRETDRAQAVMGGRAEIASMIAHELRGPVTTVRGLASTASTHYDSLSDAERLEFFQLVDQEARRLLHIVDETSMSMKVDAGTVSYDVRDEDLGRIVTNAVKKAETGDHPVTVEVPEGLRLSLDRLRLEETLVQLLDNAAKFSPPAAPIEIRVIADDREVAIDVSDRGPGVAPDLREKAFERFAKFRPPGYEEVPGPGLGLSIVRAHIEALGGRIVMEDAPGGGTIQRITLPDAHGGTVGRG